MDPFRKELTAAGAQYVFRAPSGRDMIAIDKLALDLRGGISEGLGVAHMYSQSVAMLSTLCEQPKGYDFGEMPTHILDELSAGVADWLGSFRRTVDSEKATTDRGQDS